MQPKRPLIYVLLFLAVVYAGDRSLAAMLDWVLFHSNARYSRLYEGRATAEIVVLGNSRGKHSFHAPSMEKELGVSVINLSYNALATELAAPLLEDYLEHNDKPKLLIVEVSNVRMSPEVITELKPYTGRSTRLAELLKREQPEAYFATHVSHLYRLNGEMIFQNLRSFRSSDQGYIQRNIMTQELIDRVEQTDAYTFPEAISFPPALAKDEQAKKRLEYLHNNLDALRKIVAAAQRENIELRLVIAPYWPAYRRKITNWDEVMAEIQQAAGAETPLWDYSLALEERTDFADRVHCNANGAAKLLERMKEDDFFEPGATPKLRSN